MKYIITLIFIIFCFRLSAQPSTAIIHAHNDYENAIPFFNAYKQGAGSIEADIILKNGELYVAHSESEIREDRTLDSMYLMPIQQIIAKKAASIKNAEARPLQLLIDIKTEAEATLTVLIKKMMSYPPAVFVNNPELKIVISGNVPEPIQWTRFPAFISFDGRPYLQYTPDQLQRIALISDDFKKYTSWNGKGVIVKEEKKKIADLITSVHSQGKKIRFWATPDQINAWKTLLAMGVDFIGTDEVNGLAGFLRKKK